MEVCFNPLICLLLHPLLIFLLPGSHSSAHHHLPAAPTFSVADYGAAGDGLHYDTVHIQSAIDACFTHGGGYVVFPPGNYLSATLQLRSHVFLHLQSGSMLIAASTIHDYPLQSSRWYFLLAENSTHLGITGPGTLHGQGFNFVLNSNPLKNVMLSWNSTGQCYGDECRPRLIGFIHCTNVLVRSIHVTDPPYWCLHLVRCDGVLIEDISINGDFNTPNNDGIDIEDSNNTVIQRSRIDTGDDAICPKTSTGPVHNLTVIDCWIRSKSSAIKLGSASWFEFYNLRFENITIVDSHRGLAMQIRDGGSVRNVTFRNINITTRYYDRSWWGRAEPIYMTSCRRDGGSKGAGRISEVEFINIRGRSENGIVISGGGRGREIRNVRLREVKIRLVRNTRMEEENGMVDYRPGCRGLVCGGEMAGVRLEYVEGLIMENVAMEWLTMDYYNHSLLNWNTPLFFLPSTVFNISLSSFSSLPSYPPITSISPFPLIYNNKPYS